MKTKSKSTGGFTLIEVIAVLVILGILSAVAIGKYLEINNSARISTLKSAVGAARSQASLVYYSNMLSSQGLETNAWNAVIAGNVCAKVSTDGYPDDFAFDCSDINNVRLVIKATSDGMVASGSFSRPRD